MAAGNRSISPKTNNGARSPENSPFRCKFLRLQSKALARCWHVTSFPDPAGGKPFSNLLTLEELRNEVLWSVWNFCFISEQKTSRDKGHGLCRTAILVNKTNGAYVLPISVFKEEKYRIFPVKYKINFTGIYLNLAKLGKIYFLYIYFLLVLSTNNFNNKLTERYPSIRNFACRKIGFSEAKENIFQLQYALKSVTKSWSKL